MRQFLARCAGSDFADGGGDIRRRGGSVLIGGGTIFGIVRGGTVVYDHRNPSSLVWQDTPESVSIGLRGRFVGNHSFKSAVQVWDWSYGRGYSSYNEKGWCHLGSIRGEKALHVFTLEFSGRDLVLCESGLCKVRVKLWVEPTHGGEHFELEEVVVISTEKVILY